MCVSITLPTNHQSQGHDKVGKCVGCVNVVGVQLDFFLDSGGGRPGISDVFPPPPLLRSGISGLSFDSTFQYAHVILPSPDAPSVFFFWFWLILLPTFENFSKLFFQGFLCVWPLVCFGFFKRLGDETACCLMALVLASYAFRDI